MLDPVARAIAHAPIDDKPVTDLSEGGAFPTFVNPSADRPFCSLIPGRGFSLWLGIGRVRATALDLWAGR
jgi:hypothetical protein